MSFLNKVRTSEKTYPIKIQIFITSGIAFLGICLGTFSKFLDYRHQEFPELLQTIDQILDFHNFLGGFAPWILIAVCIAIYSQTPFRAALNVFVFFVGMVSSYYIYCNFVAGFFPRSYAIIWFGFTAISPILAFICWYAKGEGLIANIISAEIIGVLINTTFAYGMFYIDIVSWLNFIVLFVTIFILHRPAKDMTTVICMGIIFSIFTEKVLPFHVW